MGDTRVLAIAGLSAPAASLATPVFDPQVLMIVYFLIPSLSAIGAPRIRFNGDTGTTAYAYSVSDNLIVPVTGIAGVASGIVLASSLLLTSAVWGTMTVGNGPSQNHALMWFGGHGVVDASVAPALVHGVGAWANTSQVTSIQLDVTSGANLAAGTGIMVMGGNP